MRFKLLQGSDEVKKPNGPLRLNKRFYIKFRFKIQIKHVLLKINHYLDTADFFIRIRLNTYSL